MPNFLPTYSDDIDALIPFSKAKLVAADIDGTLYPSELTIKAQSLIRSLKRWGVRFTLATGRTFIGVKSIASQLDIASGTPLIIYNGAVVVNFPSGELIHKIEIPPTLVGSILEASKRLSCEVFSYNYTDNFSENALTTEKREFTQGWRFGRLTSPPPEKEFNGNTIDWQSRISRKLTPATAVLISAKTKAIQESIISNLNTIDGLSITKSGGRFLEIRPKDANKATGLSVAARLLKIDAAAVLAIGDNDNDSEMLKWAGIGVAMANCSETALNSSDFICRHKVFEGAVELLEVVRQANHFFHHRRIKL